MLSLKGKFDFSPKLCALLSIFFPLLIYIQSVKEGGFVSDDYELIVNNEIFRGERPFLRVISSPFWGVVRKIKHPLDYYRPLVSLSYLIDMSLYGLNPSGFHFTNLLFHLINALLVYLIASILLSSSIYGLLTSLLFSLYPHSVESVAWISGRTDILCATFLFSCILIFLKDMVLSIKSLLVFIFTLLSMLCKEVSFGLPLFLAFLLFLKGKEGKRPSIKSFIPVLSSLLAVSVYLPIRMTVLPQSEGILRAIGPLFVAFLRIVTTSGYYLPIIFFPFIPDAFIGIKKVPPLISLHFIAGLLFVLFIGLSILFAIKRSIKGGSRESGVLYTGMMLFFIFFLPVSNLIPLGAEIPASERFLYIPSSGWGIVVIVLLFLYLKRLLHRFIEGRTSIVIYCIVATIISSEAVVTFQRIPVWRDHLTFFEKTIHEAHPRAASVWYLYGHALLMNGRKEEAIEKMKQAFDKALIFPTPILIDISLDLSILLEGAGRRDEAVEVLKAAIRHFPDDDKLKESLSRFEGMGGSSLK